MSSTSAAARHSPSSPRESPTWPTARSFGNSVVLPDGKVLALGGQQYPVAFADTSAVRSPELWDPATGGFTTMAPEAVPRTYHSVALLLPDGRVFSGWRRAVRLLRHQPPERPDLHAAIPAEP